MVNPNFKLRSGKYQGMTYEWVQTNQPNYLVWVKENRPEMLLVKVTKVVNLKENPIPFGKIQPNDNFHNEGPEWYCLPYLQKMKDIKQLEG